MSYDLAFLRREQGQSWEEAYEAFEDSGDVDLPTPEMRARLLAGAREILSDVEVFETDEVYEITDRVTAVQLSWSEGEVTIHVPYWYRGGEATRVTRTMYQLAQIVEKVSGLEGYDPQLEMPIGRAMDQAEGAVAMFDNVDTMLRRRRPTQ